MNFFKNLQLKIASRSKVMPVFLFFFFHCDVIFDKLPKLGQISCVTASYIETKDSLYLGKFFVGFFEN